MTFINIAKARSSRAFSTLKLCLLQPIAEKKFRDILQYIEVIFWYFLPLDSIIANY